MAYITKAFYDSMCTTPISDSEFDSMAERASDIVDALTFRAVERFVLVAGDAFYTRIQKATAHQCEFIMRSFGSLDAWENNAADEEASETIGNYSHTKAAKTKGLAVSPHVAAVLGPVIALGRRIG